MCPRFIVLVPQAKPDHLMHISNAFKDKCLLTLPPKRTLGLNSLSGDSKVKTFTSGILMTPPHDTPASVQNLYRMYMLLPSIHTHTHMYSYMCDKTLLTNMLENKI